MDGMGAADCLGARFRQTEKSHHAFAHKFCHGANGLFNRRVWIDAMLVIEIDHIHAQSAQTSFTSLADIIPLTADPAIVRARGITQDSKLCGNDGLLTMAAQGPSE